ncbi:ABC transporter substrate-binding protein [Donghicola sp. XS_ASV15]|uniref:ABC transporter substrate-binding protein n=1 Tax=Donghicola sp. XS_ASV15 TaxID=3241295 RepID=UPI003514E2C1
MKPLFAALALTAIPVTALAETVTVETATGPQSAPLNPATVVALDLSAIDTLNALGVEIAGIPDITPPAYLAKATQDVPTVGSLFEPDFEALAVMAPDLVIAGGRSQPKVQVSTAE